MSTKSGAAFPANVGPWGLSVWLEQERSTPSCVNVGIPAFWDFQEECKGET